MIKVNGIGRMFKTPEQKTTGSGKVFTKFRFSTRKRAEMNGQKYDYYNAVAYGKTGEYIFKYGNSASMFWFDGYLDTYSYDNRNGGKTYVTQVIVENLEFLKSNANIGDQIKKALDEIAEEDAAAAAEEPAKEEEFQEVSDDELPF